MFFIRFRQWDGENWTGWITCYCENPFKVFGNHNKYQLRILHG